MEALGEHGANVGAGTDVPGVSAAALLRGRGLRSVPGAGTPAKDTSDGGAAAGFRSDAPASDGGAAAGFAADSGSAGQASAEPASPARATPGLVASLALLDSATAAAPEELAAANFLQAADFAELTEELSRRVEYLQLQAAAAVDRTRAEAINAAGAASRAAGWTTGWGTDPEPEPAAASTAEPASATAAAVSSDTDNPNTTAPGTTAPGTTADGTGTATPAPRARPVAWSPADDGARNTAEFLRTRLRISTTEARRRLALAHATLPRTGLAGRPMPPEHEETAAALTAGIIASRAGTIITTALDKVRHIPNPGTIAEMEHNLTLTAIENDHDFLTRIAHRWIDALDQDGTEPSEETLHHRQGVFLHKKRGGLHHLEIRATTDQYEVLTTAMNTATNPRTTTPNSTNATSGTDSAGTEADGTGNDAGSHDRASGSDDTSDNTTTTDSAAAVDPDAAFNAPTPLPDLDRRTLAQQRLDGLVGGCKAALATGTLPTTGGLRPQVMVTISYHDLLNSIQTTAAQGPRYNKNRPGTRPTDSPRPTNQSTGTDGWQVSSTNHPTGTDTRQTSEPQLLPGTWQTSESHPPPGTSPSGTPPGINRTGTALPGTGPTPLTGAPTGSGTFTYTGPVTASTIRKIACDADIIPILLGSQGRILDIGRTTRVFPPHIRKALTARDQGCAFPNCTIPAPWCEAHHTTYWSQGGPTSTDTGVLLCTHHHHLIHKEQWKIHVKNGIPWFIPPPHIDPRQQPRQNHHHKT
ncbi:DUF222 domain-containing protein [Arthrobacter sp. NPDC056691]|uniref:HNH endonuclease signature motif containing protein n=1 Tax=Arthrobacter sp. NPDC056691 TaxID=3345913 RepID=UPI0036730238